MLNAMRDLGVDFEEVQVDFVKVQPRHFVQKSIYLQLGDVLTKDMIRERFHIGTLSHDLHGNTWKLVRIEKHKLVWECIIGVRLGYLQTYLLKE